MANRVVERQPIRDVAPGAVDVDRDWLMSFVREFADSFDRLTSGIFLDVTDQINVTKSIGLLFFDKVPDRVDKFTEQTIVEFAHVVFVRTSRAEHRQLS